MKTRIAMIVGAALALMAVAIVQCGLIATNNGGPDETISWVNKAVCGSDPSCKVLLDEPTVLIGYINNNCNVAAAREYRLSLQACTGQLAAIVPPLTTIPPQVVSGLQLLCQTTGYTNSTNQVMPSLPMTVTPGGNCGSASPSPTPSPSAATVHP